MPTATEKISNNSGATKSLWMEITLPSFPSLQQNEETDVCIVGSGIVGLTCAYTLLKAGKSVIVLDKGAIAGGQTARTTAHLTWALDDRFSDLEKLFGEEGARLAAESHSAAIDYIEKIVREEKIECDFVRVNGYLFVPPEDSKKIIDEEYKAIKKIGMNIGKAPKAPFGSDFDTGECLQFPNQAEFHILKYLKGLIQVIEKLGGKIYSNTHVNHFEDGTPCTVKTKSGLRVSSKSVIVATCTPINDRVVIHTKQTANRTYVIAATIPKNSVTKAMYWDTPYPYHYIRIQEHLTDPKLDWLIIGGEDHKTGQGHHMGHVHDKIEKWSRIRFPMMGKVEYRWSGQVFEPLDSLAFIGKNPGDTNTYIATGDSGNGMTHGTIAGILIPDLILGKPNPWKDLYNPSRKPLSKIPKFIETSANVAIQYGDWLTPGEKKKIESLKPDEGFILRKGLKKIAVFKDKQNQVHFNSAYCPHLGGCVRWNPIEKSWDCPCHGSRFDGCGKLLNGPASDNLYPTKSP